MSHRFLIAQTEASVIKKPVYNYDHTSKQRQAKRRALFTQMRDALRDILADPEATDGIKAKASAGLRDEEKPSENAV